MGRAFHDGIDGLILILAGIITIATVLSLLYLAKLFCDNLKKYRYFKFVAIIDTRVLVKILYNIKTELFKYVLLGIILLFELFFYLSLALTVSLSSIFDVYQNYFDERINSMYFNNDTNHMHEIVKPIRLVLLYPVLIIIPILLTLIFITSLQLFSFLCTYLKRRYNGYNIDKRVVSKHAAWWCIQAVLLFLCAIPYTQILLAVMCPLLLFINWIVLVVESRSLSRAIQSVLYEIKHFECDDVRYKASYASYKTYKVFILIQLLILLDFIFLLTLFACNCIIELFVLISYGQGIFKHFHLVIPSPQLNVLHQISGDFSHYFSYLSILLYELLNIAPFVFLVLTSLSRYFSKKIKLLKFDRHLSQPLI